ncbi:head maturation protease, ClpP-related [Streptococcus ictaluri]|uniref:ATP-dependent Clp protease proteolytic subunit n=1 Tax=Streptococcus ictaluri 707-05 TaxID=764299 RepID=G5K214_9STRE|nr:head maturation protease, ClpP-related [Streptococcus ictaluri]EHI70112.1 ATP-dependent Clp endopeptidase, proteolytic subunit ClpP-like protein [Streptococcus ictaluri 707-05]QBX16571.1 Clp protease-like protein [Streptococcus phage Javan261]
MKKFWNWKTIQNNKDEPEQVLFLNGMIAEESWFDDDVTPKQFKKELDKVEGNITVWINSPGGDCIAAAQIYNMLMDRKGDVMIQIDGIVASAATVIGMAGTSVKMSPVAMFMIHDPMMSIFGNSKEMEQAISILKEVKESIINAYEIKTGLSRAKISKLMESETWMNARTAINLGFADEVMKRDDLLDMEQSEMVALYSTLTLQNTLCDKILAKCHIQQQTSTSQGVKANDLIDRLNLMKNWRD